MWFPSVKTLTKTLQKLIAFPTPTAVFFLFFIIVDLQCCIHFCSTANKKIVLCSTGNYSQYPRVIHNGKEHEWICVCMHTKLLQWCLTLCNTMDSSPPGSSVHEILQARILEWTAMPSPRAFSQPQDRTHISLCFLHQQVDLLPLAPPGKPWICV